MSPAPKPVQAVAARSGLLGWMGKVLVSLRDVQSSYAEQNRLLDGGARTFRVLVYMDGLEQSERERFNQALKATDASVTPGTSIDIALLRPRRSTHVLYCEANCATPNHALHMVTGLVGNVLFDAGLTVGYLRAEVLEKTPEEAPDA